MFWGVSTEVDEPLFSLLCLSFFSFHLYYFSWRLFRMGSLRMRFEIRNDTSLAWDRESLLALVVFLSYTESDIFSRVCLPHPLLH